MDHLGLLHNRYQRINRGSCISDTNLTIIPYRNFKSGSQRHEMSALHRTSERRMRFMGSQEDGRESDACIAKKINASGSDIS